MLGLAFTPLLLTADVFSLCASMGVYAGSSLHSTTVTANVFSLCASMGVYVGSSLHSTTVNC